MTKSLSLLALCSALLLFMSACQDNVSPNLEESLDLFAGLEAIPEAQQTNVTINKGSDATADGYFNISVDNVDMNPFLSPGSHQAWCLEWNKNLRSNGDVHQEVKWFSTGTNDTWRPLNYLFSIRGELQANDPDLTFRDIQAVVWVLAGEMGIAPDFDVMNMPINQIPSRLRAGNELAIDREKVAGIARRVMVEAPDAVITTTGVVAQTAADEQDVIVAPPVPGITADFITIWDTRLGPGTKIVLALNGIKGSASIDWGDGTIEQFNGVNSPVHEYEKDGIYTVSFSGKASSYNSRDFGAGVEAEKLIRVRQWGTLEFENMEGAFYGAKNLELVPTQTDYLDNVIDGLENVTDMSYMFYGAESFNLPLDKWDFSSVTNMEGMLQNATSFDQAIQWDTQLVTNMSFMFSGATSFNTKFFLNTTSLEDMSYMFAEALSFNQSVESFDTRNVTTMKGVFAGAESFNQPLNLWTTDNVTDLSDMFFSAISFNQPLDQWNTGQVTTMATMFAGAQSFNKPIEMWNTKLVRNMSGMFAGALSYNQPLGKWETGSVTNMSGMFNGAVSFNQPLGNWITSDVVMMERMFDGAESFNQPIGNWDTRKVQTMAGMFRNAFVFDQDINNWAVETVTDMSLMFSGALAFNQPLDSWKTFSVEFMAGMFSDARSFNQNISNWETKFVQSMADMFNFATSFNQNISGWDTQSVTDMSGMFKEASAFNQEINDWDVANVTNMSGMFSNAELFNKPLNSWNTLNVTSMSAMFENAGQFNQPLSNWETVNVTDMTKMFRGAFLFRQNISGWNVGALESCPDEPFQFSAGSGIGTFSGFSNYQPNWSACK